MELDLNTGGAGAGVGQRKRHRVWAKENESRRAFAECVKAFKGPITAHLAFGKCEMGHLAVPES